MQTPSQLKQGQTQALMAARVVECRQWTRSGARSPEEWLADVAGVPVGVAQRTLDTATRLASQPEVAGAVRAGDISPAQAEEIASAVEKDPASAPRLLGEAAKRGFKGLKEQCRAVRLAGSSREDDEARARRQREARSCRLWSDRDGMGHLDARLAPVAFARFKALLAPFEEEAFAAARKAGVREPGDRYRADALLALAEAAGNPGSVSKSNVPAKVIVVVDRAALLRGHCLDGERCYIDGIGPVPVSVARELMSDAFVAAVITDGVDINRVVHLGRQPTEAQRTALQVRDPHCVIPGCESTERLEIDHSPDWEQTQHTTLPELARLCATHHDHKTYQHAVLSGSPGNWTWQPPPFHGNFAGPPQGWPDDAGPFDDPPPKAGTARAPEGRDPPPGG